MRITLEGVYAANHQSLGRDHLSVTTFDVHVLSAYVRPFTLNLVDHAPILLLGSARIFHINVIIQGGIILSFSSTSFL
jgi:hypothetical protein